MSNVAIMFPESADELPVAPSAERWAAMGEVQRHAFHDEVLAALERQQLAMGESRQHGMTRYGAATLLGDYFRRTGQTVYTASDLPTYYPGEVVFSPDVLAVRGVEDPRYADPRRAWVVAEEQRGLDLVLEVLAFGDRHKDLAFNVARYARLGIPEYFVYDLRNQRLYGYRLPTASARNYQSITVKNGLLRSRVLDLDLGLVNGRLRFFHGDAQIPEADELIGRLDEMIAERERQLEAENAARQAVDQARLDAVTRLEAELAARAEAEQARVVAEQARAEAERQLAALKARFGITD